MDPTEGVCIKTVREIATGTGLSPNGAQSAVKGLAEYKLILEQLGKKISDARRIHFHEHSWMEWQPARVPCRGTPVYHDAPSGVPRQGTYYKKSPKKEEESARAPQTTPSAADAGGRDVNSIVEEVMSDEF